MFAKVKDVIIDVRTIKLIMINGKVIRILGDHNVEVICECEEDAKREFEKLYNQLKVKW